jgi:hypothetical protein
MPVELHRLEAFDRFLNEAVVASSETECPDGEGLQKRIVPQV